MYQINKKISKINNENNSNSNNKTIENDNNKPLDNSVPSFLITSSNSLSNSSTGNVSESNSENNRLSFYQDAKLSTYTAEYFSLFDQNVPEILIRAFASTGTVASSLCAAEIGISESTRKCSGRVRFIYGFLLFASSTIKKCILISFFGVLN